MAFLAVSCAGGLYLYRISRLVVALALVSVVPAGAQIAMPPADATGFKDTSAFKPPNGAKVAIIASVVCGERGTAGDDHALRATAASSLRRDAR